ncbi:MAG: hypothetical protein ACRDAX_03295 [Propionibacteriaceae bacterium]
MSTSCPHCFNELPLDKFLFTCRGQCPEHDDDQFGYFHGVRMKSRPLTGWTPSQERNLRTMISGQNKPPVVQCHMCQGATVEVCPICHFVLPDEWRGSTTTCIALAGSRSSGKSVYIGVLFQFHEFFMRTSGSFMAFDPPSMKHYEKVYKKALDEARGLQGTARAGQADAAQRNPLILRGTIKGQPHAIAIRDVAGEDLEQQDAQQGALEFYNHADAVFFMFDPSAVAQIQRQLELRLPLAAPGGPPEPVLRYVLKLMGGTGKLAVIMSKFDIIHELQDVKDGELAAALRNPGAAIRRDPGVSAQYDPAEAYLLSQEVRSLLLRLDPHGIVNSIENDPMNKDLQAQYFAVSALGSQPDGINLNPSGITPYRILDPLRWVLST